MFKLSPFVLPLLSAVPKRKSTNRIKFDSQTASPIEASVQIPKINKYAKTRTSPRSRIIKISSDSYSHTTYKMRDLYHRQERLAYWIKRVDTDLQDPDKRDVLKLVEHMQDRERALLWIMRCITALLLIRKQLGKPFRNATKDDIRSILKWMEQKGYKGSTNEKFRQILKL